MISSIGELICTITALFRTTYQGRGEILAFISKKIYDE